MKPLELTIYPKVQDHFGNPAYTDPKSGELYLTQWTAEFDGDMKHFTDAELAAEYWAPTWLTVPDADWEDDYTGTALTMRHRTATLHRFATLPHALEAP